MHDDLGLSGWKPPNVVRNREDWLDKMVSRLRTYMKRRGYTVPPVTVGVGNLGRGKRTLGICCLTPDRLGNRQITISPALEDPVDVGCVLIHELVHAALPPSVGHGPRFKVAMHALGLQGQATATVPSDDLRRVIREYAKLVGPYPHAAIDPTKVGIPKKPAPTGPRGQVQRWKAVCPGKGCKSVLRFGRRTYELGPPEMLCRNLDCSRYGVAFEIREDK